MKLIYCKECASIFNLAGYTKWCECKRAWGRYVDNVRAEVYGTAVPLGFANKSFTYALLKRPFNQEGQPNNRGTTFEAFVIPENCPTVKEIKHG